MFEDANLQPIPILSVTFEQNRDDDESNVNIADAELEQLKDDKGVLWFEKLWNGV